MKGSSRSLKSNQHCSCSFRLQLIHDPWAAVGDRVLFLRFLLFLPSATYLFPAFFCVCSFSRCFILNSVSVKPSYFAGSQCHFPVIFNCQCLFLFVPHRIQSVIHGTLLLPGTVRTFFLSQKRLEYNGMGFCRSFRLFSLCSYIIPDQKQLVNPFFNLFGKIFSRISACRSRA